ncbi:MAG: hypothetical protein EXR72_19750 [Myxococcales bacterium]|nr:hypothetical protein [Myxococcales bacterium]
MIDRSSLLALAVAVAGCGGAPAVTADAGVDPGALIAVTVESQVGVLLEDLPAALRDRAATEALARPESFWIERARQQLSATRLRLGYRRYYSALSGEFKGQLPLPPREQWTFTLAPGGAKRTTVDGHDVVATAYTMKGTLLSDTESVINSEPALFEAGGVWDEPFSLPVDPDLLFQRIGYACEREAADEPHGVDGENALVYYDDLCQAKGNGLTNCHHTTPTWPVSCKEALTATIGRVDVQLHFERLPWTSTVADKVRMAATAMEPDLEVAADHLAINRVVYRYIPPDSCTIVEGCVKGSGWRRLLQFEATLKNVGRKPLHIGAVDSSAFNAHNIYEFSACHKHYHFRFYGDFRFGAGVMGDKRAFCILSTNRYLNNESTPLTVPYDSCSFQGIGPGWGDDYFAGIECQWIDVTDLDTAAGEVKAPLAFTSNPDQFLCEGTPVLDGDGKQMFEPTAFKSDSGKPIDRPLCTYTPGWDKNNAGTVDATVPKRGGGLVTAACTRGQIGPRRDCGFALQKTFDCTAGAQLKVSCTVGDGANPQLVRMCETSAVLGTAIPCTYSERLAATLVGKDPVEVGFVCPPVRGAKEPGGQWALFAAAAFEADSAQGVNCVVK